MVNTSSHSRDRGGLVEADIRVRYISYAADCAGSTITTPRKDRRPMAIPRNPGFDVFNVRLLVGLDKLLREKRRYQGDLSASINDALLSVNLNTVKLVTLQGKKKQTARETHVVLQKNSTRGNLRRSFHSPAGGVSRSSQNHELALEDSLLPDLPPSPRGLFVGLRSSTPCSSVLSYQKTALKIHNCQLTAPAAHSKAEHF